MKEEYPRKHLLSSRRLEDVFKTYLEYVSARPQRNSFSSFKTSGRRVEDVFETSWKTKIFKKSWRQTKCLPGISVSSKSISQKSLSDKSKADPKCIN